MQIKPTPLGMTRKIALARYSDGVVKTVTSQFEKKHPLFKKYGITKIITEKYPNGNNFYKINGILFNGQKFEFRSDLLKEQSSGLKMNIQTEDFLKNILEAQKSQSMENLKKIANRIKLTFKY